MIGMKLEISVGIGNSSKDLGEKMSMKTRLVVVFALDNKLQ
jgi:hypothetical protein